MKQKFQIGDIVRHKESSQIMMIVYDRIGYNFKQQFYFDGNYRCDWTEDNERKSETFSEDSLILVKKAKS